jgi:hypothetical protein
VPCRLVAGGGQEHEVDVELALGEVGVDEQRDDIVAGVLAPRVGQLAAELEHLLRDRAGEREHPVGVVGLLLDVLGVLVAEDAVAHLYYVAAVFLRDAKDLGEDLHGDLRGDLLHEVELAFG